MSSLSIPIIVAFAAACIAAITDVWKFRVYNLLTFPLMVSGFVFHACLYGTEGMVTSGTGFLFGLAVLMIPYVLGLMGAGDVKLLAGIGAWLGFEVTVVVFIASSFVSGLYALLLIVYRGKIRESWLNIKVVFYRMLALGSFFSREDLIEDLSARPDRRLRVIPYGAMILLGISCAFWWLNLAT